MAIPLIAHVRWAFEALPALAALRHGQRLPPARRWIVAYAILGFGLDAIGLWYALRQQNNHWLSYVAPPLEVATILFALACWQERISLRTVLRMLALVFAAVVVVLVAFVEDTRTFSLVRGPIESILVVGLSLMTLLALIRNEQGSLFRQDWFWICIGLTLRYALVATIGPVGRILMGSSMEALFTVFYIKAIVDIVAYSLLARGIWCPVPQPRTSGPSSSVSSPSSLSSAPSPRPW